MSVNGWVAEGPLLEGMLKKTDFIPYTNIDRYQNHLWYVSTFRDALLNH